MNAAKQIIHWPILAFAFFLPASAPTITSPENPVLEIFSIGYDAAFTKAISSDSTIDVVGSRAAGAGRNIEATLPVGKGVSFGSDVDFRIDASHPQAVALITDLKKVSGGAGSASAKFSTTIRPITPPFIRFMPKQ